jgi:hypothetical protein
VNGNNRFDQDTRSALDTAMIWGGLFIKIEITSEGRKINKVSHHH